MSTVEEQMAEVRKHFMDIVYTVRDEIFVPLLTWLSEKIERHFA